MTGTQPLAIQAVVFRLGAELFALPVTMVREILDHRQACHMPGAPGWMLGLTDVRGQSVPIIDLRLRMGMAVQAADETTRILVVDLPDSARDGGPLVLGLVVDKVLDVADFTQSAIEDIPEFGGKWQAEYIRSVMRRSDGFVLLLDLAGVVTGVDLEPLVLDPAA
jgi:purine-binding chemotaxis protein CheW